MRLFTVQPLEVVDRLVKDGRFVCDITKSWADDEDNPRFLTSYDWLAERMVDKIGPSPDGVKYPVWAWFRRDIDEAKCGAPTEVGEKCAIVTFDIDDDKVVLSDFWKWEESAFMDLPYVDESKFEDEDDAVAEYDRIKSLGKDAVRKTWEAVFDLSDAEAPIQATFWELRKEDVVSIEYFEIQACPEDDDSDGELD